MSLRMLLVVSALMALAGCAATQSPPPPTYRDALVVYPSGLRLLVHQNPKAPQASVSVSYGFGAANEPQEKAGLAHLATQVILFSRPEGAHAPPLKQQPVTLEARFQAVTRHDATLFSTTASPRHLRRLLTLEAQRMSEPLAHVTELEFALIRDAQARLLREGQRKSVDDFMEQWLLRTLVPEHPTYGRSRVGTPESLAPLTLEDVRAFLQAYFTPAHAVIVVSGPASPEEVRSEVARAFSQLTGEGSKVSTPPVQHSPPKALPEPLAGRPMPVLSGPGPSPMLWMAWAVPGTSERSASLAALASTFIQLEIRGALINDSRVRKHLRHTLSRVITLEGMSLVIAIVEMDEAEAAQEIARLALQGIDDRSRWKDPKALDLLLGSGTGLLRHWEEQFPAEEAAALLRTQGRPDFLVAGQAGLPGGDEATLRGGAHRRGDEGILSPVLSIRACPDDGDGAGQGFRRGTALEPPRPTFTRRCR
jgi:zinc protease